METKGSYYVILFVYIFLWSCQMLVCHLTHSLIVLTDSYINLYKILDISLGLLHLHTQQAVRKRNQDCTKQKDRNLSVSLFDRICTYQFKRIPLLGTFMNGLFLAALLMSAAIEGIQTCFHASHLVDEGEKSILLRHPITYPGILIGFALVGIVMQWCSSKAHQMREEELGSESLLELRRVDNKQSNIKELNVKQLSDLNQVEFEPYPPVSEHEKRNTICLGSRALTYCVKDSEKFSSKFVINSVRHRSFESVPLDSIEQTQISLKSLKIPTSLENPNLVSITAISPVSRQDIEARAKPVSSTQTSDNRWLMVRYFTSPSALIACALIIYLINDELVTEVSDATLAILVVILLFTFSYPPMKKAGKVLLQTAPEGVDLEILRSGLLSVSPIIVDIDELHVWSLTPMSNRIGTCHLVINKSQIESEKQLSVILTEAKFKFLEQNIKCSTIQPIFLEESDKILEAQAR